jgi:hypothetical protein
MSRKKKKRSFLLLEVLIAFSLMGLVATYFVTQGGKQYLAKVEGLKQIEADRIAAWTFTEIYDQFAKGELRWEQIPPLRQKSARFSLPAVSVRLSPFQFFIKRSFTLETLRQKEQKEGGLVKFVSVHLKVNQKQFSYPFIAVKGP